MLLILLYLSLFNICKSFQKLTFCRKSSVGRRARYSSRRTSAHDQASHSSRSVVGTWRASWAVIGGWNGSTMSTVERYNPATDTWTEDAPLLVSKGASYLG